MHGFAFRFFTDFRRRVSGCEAGIPGDLAGWP